MCVCGTESVWHGTEFGTAFLCVCVSDRFSFFFVFGTKRVLSGTEFVYEVCK